MAVRPVEPGEEEPVLGQCRVRAVGEQAGKTAAAVGAPFQSSMEWSCRNQPRKWAKLPNFPFGLWLYGLGSTVSGGCFDSMGRPPHGFLVTS